MPGGSLEMTFRVAGLDEIKSWILSFGLEAVVLDPPELQDQVRRDLLRNLEQYRSIRALISVSEDSRVKWQQC